MTPYARWLLQNERFLNNLAQDFMLLSQWIDANCPNLEALAAAEGYPEEYKCALQISGAGIAFEQRLEVLTTQSPSGPSAWP